MSFSYKSGISESRKKTYRYDDRFQISQQVADLELNGALWKGGCRQDFAWRTESSHKDDESGLPVDMEERKQWPIS